MRIMIHLHLTRFMRYLLDRKDRLSMALGLEVRVPFCYHRIVEYVYNAPWALKTYDGREKSLLRGAVKDMLPASVTWRPKSAYPSTQAPQHDPAKAVIPSVAQLAAILTAGDYTFLLIADLMSGCRLRNSEATAVNLCSAVARDVYRLTEQVNHTSGQYARLKHRKVGSSRPSHWPPPREGSPPSPNPTHRHRSWLSYSGDHRPPPRIRGRRGTPLHGRG